VCRRVLYKICKKCISRVRAPRGRDAWDPLIDIKSDRVYTTIYRTLLTNIVNSQDIYDIFGGFFTQWARRCGALLARVRVRLAAACATANPGFTPLY
jgi:hypothetical protein